MTIRAHFANSDHSSFIIEEGVPFAPVAGEVRAGDAYWQFLLSNGVTPDPFEEVTLVPERVSAFQAREALAQTLATAPGYDSLLAQVEDVVAQADDTTKRAWAFATEFRRNSPTIATLAQAMSLTDEQLDDLFILAAQIAA